MLRKTTKGSFAPEKRGLLFFYTHEHCPARATVMPVLAWLGERVGLDYDGYFCVRPSVADIGDALPFVGNQHDQQFFFTSHFYHPIYFCALTEEPGIQFERFLKAKGDATIIKRSSAELADFYFELFDIFNEPLPSSAVVFPSSVFQFPNEKIELGDFKIPGESRLDSICYPEIFYRQALGIHYELPDAEFNRLKAKGVERIYAIFCPPEAKVRFEAIGLSVEIIDRVDKDDTYTSISKRLVERWLTLARGLALGNDPITLKWTPKYLRDRVLPIMAVQSLPQAVEVIKEYTDKIGNKVVWGSQIFNDRIFSDLSKGDVIVSLVHDVEVGITGRNQIRMPLLWLKQSPAPWEVEYSDEYLNGQIGLKRTAVCFLHYASDLGHLPVLPRLLDLHSIDGFSGGIAFPASWWEYADERLEQLYLSKEMGGIFPSVEPLLSSAGLGVATEARGYLSPQAYLASLKKAMDIIRERAGKRHVPIGHYPFQDACPYYQHNTAEPQFDVLAEAGFQYAITYKNEGKYPEIVYSRDNFIVLNQQSLHWSFNPMSDLGLWESKMLQANRPGWIILGTDAPFWGMVPCYFGLASKGLSLTDLQKAMSYARDGGSSGKLFLARPHEVARYAILLSDAGVFDS